VFLCLLLNAEKDLLLVPRPSSARLLFDTEASIDRLSKRDKALSIEPSAVLGLDLGVGMVDETDLVDII